MISPTQRPLPDNTQHSQQVTIPPAGYEPKFPPNERPQNHALDRAATVIGRLEDNNKVNFKQEEKLDLIGLERCPVAGYCLCHIINYYYYYYYYLLQLDCHPVAVVILHVYKI